MSDTRRVLAEEVRAMAGTVGVSLPAGVAARIAGAVDPTITGFARVSDKLPFDVEPASFVVVQNSGNKS
jgi:hypothetical protein